MKTRFSEYLMDMKQSDKVKSSEKIFDNFSEKIIKNKDSDIDLERIREILSSRRDGAYTDISVPENITFEGIYNALIDYPLKMSNICPDSVGGAYNPVTRKIYINQKSNKIDQIHSLLHELCHYLLKHDVEEHSPRCELEAEFSTYIVEKMMGFKNNHSQSYIIHYCGKGIDDIEKTIEISRDDILRTSRLLLKSLKCYL